MNHIPPSNGPKRPTLRPSPKKERPQASAARGPAIVIEETEDDFEREAHREGAPAHLPEAHDEAMRSLGERATHLQLAPSLARVASEPGLLRPEAKSVEHHGARSAPSSPVLELPLAHVRLPAPPSGVGRASHAALPKFAYTTSFAQVLAHEHAAPNSAPAQLARALLPIARRPEGLKIYTFEHTDERFFAVAHDPDEMHRASPTQHAQMRMALAVALSKQDATLTSAFGEDKAGMKKLAAQILTRAAPGRDGGLRLHYTDGRYLLDYSGSYPALPQAPNNMEQAARFYAAVLRQATPVPTEVGIVAHPTGDREALQRFAKRVAELLQP